MNVFDYKWWWSRIGGRPWTYILRDTWYQFEGLWIIGLVAIGALLGHWLWDLIFWFLLVFALGYVAGHLFWGTKYVPNQQDDSPRANQLPKREVKRCEVYHQHY